MIESGQAILFLWNKVECCGINLGFDFHEKEKQCGLWDSTTSREPQALEDLDVLQVQRKLEKDQANGNTWVSANAPHSFPPGSSTAPCRWTWEGHLICESHGAQGKQAELCLKRHLSALCQPSCGQSALQSRAELTTQLIQSSPNEPGRLVVCKTELLGGMLTVIMHQQRTAVICVYLYWSLNNTVSFFFLHVCLFDFKLVGSCCTWLRHKTQMKSFKIKLSWNVFTGIAVKASYDITRGKVEGSASKAPGSSPCTWLSPCRPTQEFRFSEFIAVDLKSVMRWDQVLPSRFTT